MEGEEPYEYKDPVQKPIEPPYKSFLDNKNFPLSEHEVNKTIEDVFDPAMKNPTISSVGETSTTDYSDYLSKWIKELKVVNDLPNTSDNCAGQSKFINPQDFIKEVKKERDEISKVAFQPSSELLCDLKPLEEINISKLKEQQQDYKNLADLLAEQYSGQEEEHSEEELQTNESEIMKIVKKALFGKQAMTNLSTDAACSNENKKELSFKCICNEDSDSEEDA